MGYHKEFPSGTIVALEGLLKTAKDVNALRRVQSIYYRAKHDYSSTRIAQMTGYSVGTVRNLHAAFLRNGLSIFELGTPGGRNAAYMTPEKEAAFLSPFIEAGDSGGILEVGSIHKAHCKKLGKEIPLSTTYRLLHRHGWRKITPRSRHPKADQGAQAVFKKMA